MKKVRCKNCGEIVKYKRSERLVACPSCGGQVMVSMHGTSSKTHSTSSASLPPVEELPTRNTSSRTLGCLIVGFLLFAGGVIVAAVSEDNPGLYIVLLVLFIIAVTTLGVWFEKKSIKRR